MRFRRSNYLSLFAGEDADLFEPLGKILATLATRPRYLPEWPDGQLIKGFIAKYRNFSPYEEGDFMQEAFEAALRVSQRSRKNGIAFEAAFWVIFKSQVRVIMPHPGSNSHGSNSVPSHLCSGDLALIANHQEPRHEQPDIDALYHAVCPVLTEKERQVLFLALGLGC